MENVDFFYAALGRLKVALRVSTDKAVAEALGLGEKAFNARKTRGSFPEKELRALAQQRPELGIDVEYVLTGGVLSPHQRKNIDAARQFTLTLQGINEEQREHMLQLNEEAGLEAAATNARRQDILNQSEELFSAFRSDATAELALLLLRKLYKAELIEDKTKSA